MRVVVPPPSDDGRRLRGNTGTPLALRPKPIRGCPRNCERLAIVEKCHWRSRWEGWTKATTREPGDLPRQMTSTGGVPRRDARADGSAVRGVFASSQAALLSGGAETYVDNREQPGVSPYRPAP